MSVERRSGGGGFHRYRRLRLLVRVHGKTVFDRMLCRAGRCSPGSHHALALRNVWGDDLAEPVVNIYTGGAHCCFESLIVLVDGAHPGRLVGHDWSNSGYRGQLRGGTFEFVTADNRFAYAFSSFAASGLPVQVWAIDPAGRFADVTSTRPDLVRVDTARFWGAYRSGRRSSAGALGVLAAWCADEYRLGASQACNAELQRALGAGDLAGQPGWPRNGAFVYALKRSLRSWGYVAR